MLKMIGKIRQEFRRRRMAKAAADYRKRGNVTVIRHMPTEYEILTTQLTNWQRTMWAKAGYPGLRQRDAEMVRPFSKLVKPAKLPA